MSAVQIPQEFTPYSMFVSSYWHQLRLHSRLHPYDNPRCFRTTWCSWANCCWQITSVWIPL